jgi:hypothetical protein
MGDLEVERFQIIMGQPVDFKGQPQHETKGGQFLVTLTQLTEDFLYEWGSRPGIIKSGAVVFRSPSIGKVLNIEFYDAYCTTLIHKVNAFSGTESQFIIAPREIKMNGYEHINWEIK